MAYRNTSQSTTGETPAMILQKLSLRSRLNRLRSVRSFQDRIRDAQQILIEYAGGVTGELSEGNTVMRVVISGQRGLSIQN